jgi:hypothetical protein
MTVLTVGLPPPDRGTAPRIITGSALEGKGADPRRYPRIAKVIGPEPL